MKAFAGKRVLMLIENNPFRPDPRVRQEATALIAAGYQVSVICPASTKWVWKEKVDGAWVFSYPAPPPANGFIGYLWEFGYSLVATFVLSIFVAFNPGFDVIHAANPPDTAVFIAAFYKLFGKYFIFDHHDLVPEMYGERFKAPNNKLIFKILIWMEKISCRLADHVIATNNSYKTMEMERDGVSEKRITIVRNGPNLKRLYLVDPDDALRRKGKTIIGFVGVMARQDGVDYLLRALHQLAYQLNRNDFYCVIVGSGSTLRELKSLVTQLKLDEKVWFTGYIPHADLLRYLSTADICIDPDPSNSFNDRCTMIKMMEYMAMSKPIVAFDLPEHRVTAKGAALYARPNDELDFARQIELLMDNPEQRKEMGRIGRERIEKELAWDYQTVHLIKAYEMLLLKERT